MAKFESLTELLEKSVQQFSNRELFGEKKGGTWKYITYGDFKRRVDDFRGALADLGVGSSDPVAIVSNNRVEWAVAAYAAYGRGASFVPMYEAQPAEDWEFILNDCNAKVVIGATRGIYDQLEEMKPRLSSLEQVIGLDLPKSEAASYQALLERGADKHVDPIMPKGDDIAALIYTSGTTGKPKGVKLSHENICTNINAVHQIFPFEPEERSLSFLPWAHSFGQTCELHNLVSQGCSMAINDDIANLVENLAEVKPTLLYAVPRIFNRIYDGVNKQMAEKPAFIQQLFASGVRNATKKNSGEPLGPLASIGLGLAEKLIFSKVRQRFGGRLKYVVSGSAALSKEVAEFIDALGIEVYEGYGLTETSPIATANYPGNRKIGSVGKPIPEVTVKIDKEATGDPKNGEVIVYGPNVMQGYHNRPEENDKVLLDDGGFRTGDMGHLDEDGYLYITGRIKEQYKLENGKYVVPAPLEEELKLSPYIANVMIHGHNKPFNVALVVPDLEAVKKWAADQSIDLGNDVDNHPKVVELLQREIDERSSRFKNYEKPKKITVVTDDFTPENGMLTPTLKLKRRNVLAEYGNKLEALY